MAGHKPKLYSVNAASYTNNGLGFLPNAQSCKVKEKLNGGLELEMYYPISGSNYKNIQINSIILSPINDYDAWQPFRVYNISRPQTGIVKINAEHKCYELEGYPCLPNDEYIETPGSCSSMMQYLQSEAARTSSALSMPVYTFTTDITASKNWNIESPTDIWSVMSLVAKLFQGEWKYDGTTCRLCAKRGEDRHVKVQYGSNLQSLTQDEVDTSYTHIMPYWTDGTTTVYIDNYYIIASYTEERMQKKVLILNLSSEFEEEPTPAELRDAAILWGTKNPPKGVEKNLKVNFISRGQTVEYASFGDIDHVELGDTIAVESNPLNISSSLRCISLIYDVLRGRYETAELGVYKNDLSTLNLKTNEGRTEPTVWISVAEPVESYKSGDYWIKIDNEVTRNAQGLGRYTNGKWLLLCEFASGTGKFLDAAKTSVAHNDLEHNTSEGIYDSVNGYKNTITGTPQWSDDRITSGGVNTAFGQHNTIANTAGAFVWGEYNHAELGQYNTVGGTGNNVSGSLNTVLGVGNRIGNVGMSLVHGAGIIADGLNSSALFGQGHYISGNAGADYILVTGLGARAEIPASSTKIGLLFIAAYNGNKVTIDTSGNVQAAGTYGTMGADYAEYFEWEDGNPDNEDRRGILVTLCRDKIIPAHGNDYIGIISAKPSIVGNDAEMHWHGKYKTDVFGNIVFDESSKPIISDEYKKQRYIPRSKRPEWGLVGLIGRLVLTDDGSCKTGSFVSAKNGIGTSCSTITNARVLKRIDANHVEVLLK